MVEYEEEPHYFEPEPFESLPTASEIKGAQPQKKTQSRKWEWIPMKHKPENLLPPHILYHVMRGGVAIALDGKSSITEGKLTIYIVRYNRDEKRFEYAKTEKTLNQYEVLLFLHRLLSHAPADKPLASIYITSTTSWKWIPAEWEEMKRQGWKGRFLLPLPTTPDLSPPSPPQSRQGRGEAGEPGAGDIEL